MSAAPVPGAQPGETITIGPNHRWLAYRLHDGYMVAALYLDGALVRRGLRGWWVAGFAGERVPVARPEVEPPDDWPVHPEQEELCSPRPRRLELVEEVAL